MSAVQTVSARPEWGGWQLNRETYVLELFEGDRWIYEIDLEACLTPAQTLDWICQAAGKRWATDQRLAGLVRAIDDIIHPQGKLCSHGQNSSISTAEVREMVENRR